MTSHAGIAQFAERRTSPPEAQRSNPAPRSTTIAQAFAAGLQQDAAAREAGRADRAAGLPWRLSPADVRAGAFDVFAYASGYFGQRIGR